jgi:ParB-like chromosome segregation protein Spo0J
LKIEDLQIDPELRDLLPPLSKDEYKDLENSILKYGVQDAIKVWTDEQTDKTYVVDGHNRYNICKKHKIPIEYWQIQELGTAKYSTKQDVIKYMLDTQLGRRNLTPAQRYAIASKYKSLFEEKAKHNMSDGGKGLTNLSKVNTRKQMAKAVGVSEGSIAKLDKIYQSDNNEVKKNVMSGETSIDAGFKQIVNKTAKIKSGDKIDQFSNTNDCDQAISELDQKEKQIKEEKQELYLIRQKLYDESPDDDLRCEVEEVGQNEESYFNWEHEFVFYIVKGNNRKEVERLNQYTIQDAKSINEWIDIAVRKHNLSNKEKTILASKIFETRQMALEKEKKKEEQKEKFYKKLDEQDNERNATLNQILEIVKIMHTNPSIKEIISAGYKALAKKYHPDIIHDDGKHMQTINEAKAALDRLIG